MKRASLFIRFLAVVVVVLSPWLKPRVRDNDTRHVVYVIDRSESIGAEALGVANAFLRDAWAARDRVRLGAVAVDARAELVAPLGSVGAPTIELARAGATDLAAGIRLAAGTLPTVGHRSIVVLSDARPTRGDAEAEVRAAAAAGIRVDVVPLSGQRTDEATVTSIQARAIHVAEGQPVALDVEVQSNEYVWLEWSRDGKRMRAVPVAPRSKKDGGDGGVTTTKVELLDPAPPPGTHVYSVRAIDAQAMRRSMHGDADAEPEAVPKPGSSVVAVNVEGKAHAVVFSGSSDAPPVLAAALAESGLGLRVLPLDRAADPSSFSGADLVVLSDVRVSEAATDDAALTRPAQLALIDYVQQGGGLLVTGGVFGLAPEYASAPIARVIPVEIEDKGHVEDPPVALAIMLDRSGSMSAQVGTHTKIELAIEASLAAADMLRPSDHVAIASVDERTHWDVPLGPAERLSALRGHVRRVRADGGGIYVYTALRDAYRALATARAPLRHVILFSDTGDSEEQHEGCPFQPCTSGRTAESLAREARLHGITTTVVGIGEEAASDTAFLQRLAAAAGGRFYRTEEGTDLRRIFLSETRVLAQSNLRDKPTAVGAGGLHPVLESVNVASLPSLSAYVATNRRAGADNALLTADEGRPLLATWRYGLGKAAALTTDLLEGWGPAWAASSDAAQVLRQSVRFLLRQQSAHRADTSVQIRDRVVEVDIELPPESPDNAGPATIEVFAVDAAGTSKRLDAPLEPRGPGRWTARARSNGEPLIIARARDARGALMAEALGREDRSAELAGEGADERLAKELARLGEGRFEPSAEDTLVATAHPGKDLEATWPWSLLVAAGLVVLDLWLRRFARTARGNVPQLRDLRGVEPIAG